MGNKPSPPPPGPSWEEIVAQMEAQARAQAHAQAQAAIAALNQAITDAILKAETEVNQAIQEIEAAPIHITGISTLDIQQTEQVTKTKAKHTQTQKEALANILLEIKGVKTIEAIIEIQAKHTELRTVAYALAIQTIQKIKTAAQLAQAKIQSQADAKKQVDDIQTAQVVANEAVVQAQADNETGINNAIFAQEFEKEQEKKLRELEALELEITRIMQVADTAKKNSTQTTQVLTNAQTTVTQALNLAKEAQSAIALKKSEQATWLTQIKEGTKEAKTAKVVAEETLTAAQAQVALITQRLLDAQKQAIAAEAAAAAIPKIEQFRNNKQNRIAINKFKKLPIGVYSSNNMSMYATVGRY